MDPITNPFSPGAGSPPKELVGREQILKEADILLKRISLKRPEKSIILTGLRGVGKTVLLNEIEASANKNNYMTILVEAHDKKSLVSLLVPHLRKALYDLNRIAKAGQKVRQGLAILKSFVGAIKVSFGDFQLGLDIDPEKGTADSGDLEIDLPQLFLAVAEAAEEQHRPLVILIDEIQYLKKSELSALIMAMHKMQQRKLPLVLIAAGLPVLPGLAGESKSYAERLFNFTEIGPLSKTDAFKVLQKSTDENEIIFDNEALSEIFRVTQGYPYFLQEWGYHIWNQTETLPINIEVVHSAHNQIIQRLDNNFFKVRFDRLTPKEALFLRVMAELKEGTQRTGEIAAYLKSKITDISQTRDHLIKKGMIYSPAHGDIAFTVPLFASFMKRAIPTISKHSLEQT